MTEREKIIDIIKNKTKEPIIINGVYLDDFNIPKSTIDNIADALIANGIGDISELKHKASFYEPYQALIKILSEFDLFKLDCTIDGKTYNGKYDCKDCKHSNNFTKCLTTNVSTNLKDLKHRAEVAERALRIAGDKFINEVCNMRAEDISDKCDYKCDTCFYDYYIQQAEKEIEEE